MLFSIHSKNALEKMKVFSIHSKNALEKIPQQKFHSKNESQTCKKTFLCILHFPLPFLDL